jgi:phosphatidylglycerol---prolipoprotein diacylglyceryl transferase
MYPNLFKIPVPEFLQGFLPGHIIIHTYGFCIALGILVSYFYLIKRLKKQLGVDTDQVANFVMLITITGILGGKLAFFFENPSHYFGHPANMIRGFGSGFVFYGSFILALPILYFYFKKHNWPKRKMLDNIAVVAIILLFFGRLGCFSAGCCHGIRTESWLGVVFSSPYCVAYPLNTPLYPTQLFEAGWLAFIFLIIYLLRNKKQYDGQLFIIYSVLYAVGRFGIEYLRGDSERGFLFNGAISHSQFIAIIIVIVAISAHFYMKKKYSYKKINDLGKDTSECDIDEQYERHD